MLSRILQFIKNHLRNYCNASCTYGNPIYQSMDSSLEALQRIKHVRNAKTITTADFSTLYTSLPLQLITQEIFGLVCKMFQNSRQKYLCVSYKSCYYSDQFQTKGNCYTKEDVQEMVYEILNNTVVNFAGFSFQQFSGIPMGGNASPLLADLTLTALEWKHTSKMSYNAQKEMGMCCWYFDDLLNVNGKDFIQRSKTIYPASLPLEETTKSSEESDFLDITIKLGAPCLETMLYNKVDAFNFDVIRFPNASSNIHSGTGYNTFFSRLICIARICSNVDNFESAVNTLCDVFLNKGFSNTLLLNKAKKFASNYKALVFSLGYSSTSQIMLFFKQMLL